jgi:hypothetical protein
MEQCCNNQKLYYQEQVNHTFHLISECQHHGKTYLHYIPNLKIPTYPSKKLQKERLQISLFNIATALQI